MAAAGVTGNSIGGLQGLRESLQPERLSKTPVGGAEFREALTRATQGAAQGASVSPAAVTGLKFSAHAVDRMKSRGISFPPEVMKGIEGAVDRAAQKGARDTLVLAGDNALIVSVKNNTVVTVMDRQAMRENVFTNIDSTVVV